MTVKSDSSENCYRGLTEDEVIKNRLEHGDNVLTPPEKVSLWKLYAEKYKDPIIRILLFAALISLLLAFVSGDFIETMGIFIAVFLATTIGFYFERDAARKFDVLTSLDEEQPVKVRRSGSVCQIARKDVVVGDIVLVEVGDEVPADGMLVNSTDLQIDESTLTGEPIKSKHAICGGAGSSAAGCVNGGAGGTYPEDVLLRGTMVMNGRGEYRVTAVGDTTEIGRVARSSSEFTMIQTPLNMQLDRLAKMISKWGFGMSVAAFVIFLGHDMLTEAVWHTDNYVGMAEVVLRYFMMAVTLIVMAVPEGLPMAVTLSLALNMRRMLKNNNLVRKLHACETMGAVTVICTDKTGTLTQNRMQVAEMWIPSCEKKITDSGKCLPCGENNDAAMMLHDAISMNTTAHIDNEGRGVGNPTEAALLMWIDSTGGNYKTIRESCDIIWQLPFSTERKYMATIAQVGNRRLLYVKGAPEIVMGLCVMGGEEKAAAERWLSGSQSRAMRTLAMACAEAGDDTEWNETSSVKLRLQGIAAISDPLRNDVPDAVAKCRNAGIDVKIVTGDTEATAMEIARQIGIVDGKSQLNSISGPEFAALSDDAAYGIVPELKVMSRARPSDKQRLVQMLQKHGEIVAVTGDGTNDAPALNHAHVGLSLGSGTSVAKEASDMTLLDDSFRSIVHAVMWGRSLYINIRRFLFFQLIVNVTALLLVLGGSIIGTEMPLTVTQILWVNLIMDTFAAMALASLPPSEDVLNDKPRHSDDFIISNGMWRGIAFVGVAQFIVMFAMLIYCLKVEPGVQLHELSLFFTTFVMLQFWNLFNAKALCSDRSAFHGFINNRGLHVVLLLILFGQWLIVTFGGKMFRTVPLSAVEWIAITVATSAVLWIGEGWRAYKNRIVKSR